jgi:hypothetical protein
MKLLLARCSPTVALSGISVTRCDLRDPLYSGGADAILLVRRDLSPPPSELKSSVKSCSSEYRNVCIDSIRIIRWC